MKFQNRIRGLVDLPGTRVLPTAKNFRLHPDRQRSVLRGMLAHIGIVDTVLVRPADPEALEALRALKPADARGFAKWSAGYAGDFVLVDGHLRAEEIRDQALSALVLDLDEPEAAAVLATFDPVGDLAGFDRAKYLALTRELVFENKDVRALVDELSAADKRMREGARELEEDDEEEEEEEDEADDTSPAPDQSAQAEVPYVVLVECKDEAAQLKTIEFLMSRGYACRALT
jgi:hypothetical protein